MTPNCTVVLLLLHEKDNSRSLHRFDAGPFTQILESCILHSSTYKVGEEISKSHFNNRSVYIIMKARIKHLSPLQPAFKEIRVHFPELIEGPEGFLHDKNLEE